MKTEKILLIQTAFIGDAILASSLIENIREEKPEAEIHLLLRKGNEVLFQEHPYLKKVWIWNKSEKYKSLVELITEIRKERFDWLFCVQRFGSMGFLSTFSKAKKIVGFKKNPWSTFFHFKIAHEIGNGEHEVIRNQMLLEPWLGKQHKLVKPKLYALAKHKSKIQEYITPNFVCMFPTSVWFTKQLPPHKWVELTEQHPDKKIYLMGAPSDVNACTEILRQSKHNNIEVLCGKLNLMESMALMQQATMNFVNDSAPLHLASATNSPVTAFFCSTIPKFGFTPLSDETIIVDSKEELTCRPCGLHGKKACPEQHFKCGNTIEIPTA